MTEETKKKISNTLKGRKPTWLIGKKFSDEHRQKLSLASKGKQKSVIHCKKISVACRGEKRWNWKGGITPINVKIRSSPEYRLWRKAVFKRDNWTCVWCYKRGGKLNADHIKPFAHYPELRFAIDNGRTLCVECHKKTDSYGAKNKKLT